MKKLVSCLLCVAMLFSMLSLTGVAANEQSYKIVSPYEDVIWDGDGAWGAYKGSLHSHTTYSDASTDLPTMVKEYYEQDYDFLANADHGVTGVEWNREPTKLWLYSFGSNNQRCLTDEEFEAITNGTYPLYDGTIRNKKLVCVTGANELNNLTITKCHVNGYFLPEKVGDGYAGKENGYDEALQFIEENGGISHINHPGDWLNSNKDIKNVSDPENIKFFGDLILKYKSCYGMEVFNEDNGTTGYDRILWDNMLMYTLPYGKTVIGYSNTDAHDVRNVDSSFSVFMMEENNVENIRATMENGAFFCVSRHLRANDIIGPDEEIDAMNKGFPYPIFTSVKVNDHTISVTAKDAQTVQWIANGKVIASGEIKDNEPVKINLDEIDGAEDFQYIRAEVFGEGGICLTQALVIDDGGEVKKYEEPSGIGAWFEKLLFEIKSTRLWCLVEELF